MASNFKMGAGGEDLLSREIDPRVIFFSFLRAWYWLVIAILVGGLLGLGVSYLRPARYQAAAALRVDLTGEAYQHLVWPRKRELLTSVRVLMLGDETMQAVLSLLGDQSEFSSPAELREHLRLNDFEDQWMLGTIHEDPHEAAIVANAWAQAASTGLGKAVDHAASAIVVQSRLEDLGCELAGGSPAAWDCPPGAATESIASLVEEWEAHRSKSHGVPAAVEHEFVQEASAPDRPIYWGRGALILSGAFLGLLIGMALSIATARALA